MVRKLRLEDAQGRPLARRRVEVWGRADGHVSEETDSVGLLIFDWESEEISRVEIDGAVVARDLSLPFSGSDEIRVVSRVETDDKHQYRLTLRYPDRSPVAGKAVWLHDRYGKVQRHQSDQWGRIEFTWPDDYIELIEVDQRPVERVYSLLALFGKKYELEIEVPHLTGGSSAERSDLRHRLGAHYGSGSGFRGRLYHQDGTQVSERLLVQASFPGHSGALSTEDAASYCNDDGEFFIVTPTHVSGQRPTRVWVDRMEVRASDYTRDDESGFYVILVPAGFLATRGSERGGVVAGLVVDHYGGVFRGAQIDVEVIGSGFLSAAPPARTHSNENGQFILMFSGGVRIKQLYVDGNPPARIYLKRGDEENLLAVEQIRPGTFGLHLEKG
jgi:hypothetical protein